MIFCYRNGPCFSHICFNLIGERTRTSYYHLIELHLTFNAIKNQLFPRQWKLCDKKISRFEKWITSLWNSNFELDSNEIVEEIIIDYQWSGSTTTIQQTPSYLKLFCTILIYNMEGEWSLMWTFMLQLHFIWEHYHNVHTQREGGWE